MMGEAEVGFYESLAGRLEENCNDIEIALASLRTINGVLDLTLDRLRGLQHLDCTDLCHTVQGCADDFGYEDASLESLLRENREAEAHAREMLQDV